MLHLGKNYFFKSLPPLFPLKKKKEKEEKLPQYLTEQGVLLLWIL